jgi:protein AaeX
MIKEINLGGVYLSPFLAYMGAAAVIWALMRLVFDRIGLYRVVWHPALFNTALYLILLTLVVGVSM